MSETADTGIPPILAPQPPPLPPPRAAWRWMVHLLLLSGYVLGVGLIGWQIREPGVGDAALPKDVPGLLKVCGMEMVMFGLVFALACFFSKAKVDELYLRWRGGIKPILWGALHSVLLRVAIAILLMIAIAPFAALKGEKEIEKDLQGLRPKVETVLEPHALEDPIYLVLTLTLVSFVVAGLREELWRAGMLAGLAGLAPSIFGSRKGQFLAVLVAAVIFGLGHAPQGWGGVVLTGLLGIGLGAIMVWHRSIWEAALAHGFFNASTFVMLYVVIKWAPQFLEKLGIS